VTGVLQLLAGGLVDGAVVVEAGEFGVSAALRSRRSSRSVRGVRLRGRGHVDAGPSVPDPDMQVGAGPLDHVIGGAVTGGERLDRHQVMYAH